MKSQTKQRKVFFYTIDVHLKNSDEESEKQEEILDQLFKKALNKPNLINKMDYKNKTVMISSIKSQNGVYEIIWRSCNYNHSPDYMNSDNGTMRASNKAVNEGEAELTHSIIFKDSNKKYIIILEKNSVGTFISEIKAFLMKLLNEIETMKDYNIECSKIVTEDVEDAVSRCQRITQMNIYADIETFGSELLSNSILANEDVRKQGMVQLKVQRKKTFSKENFFDTFHNRKVKRLRAKIIDQSNTEQIIDTLNWSKKSTINIVTDEKGVAISSDLMDQLRSIMKEYLS